jgi:methyl-accepting chemotaxis protein
VSMTTGSARPRRSGSIRLKLFAVAGVGILTAIIASTTALVGLATMNSDVVTLDHHAVQPLAAFTMIRDGEGDSRYNVWDYVAAAPQDRAAVTANIKTSDAAVTDAVALYLSRHGSSTDARGQAMTSFAAKFAAWQHVRDTVVLPAADAGQLAAAYAAIRGPLADADNAMGTPLDQLFTAEQSAGAATAAGAAAGYSTVRMELVAVATIGVLIAVVVAWWMTRRMLAVIAVVRESLSRLAAGDLTWQAPAVASTDELAQMVGASAAASTGMRTVVAQVVGGVATLNGSVTRLQGSSGGMESAAAKASSQVDEAASEVQVVNGNIQAVATGTEQMSASIREIASNAQEAAQVAQSAVETAGTADERVRRLNDSSTEIITIIKVITSIAQQTNLLALNATIEAARAGDAGKGFAVVAGEVKELANETARATGDITSRVMAIQVETGEVVDAIGRIRSVIEHIDELQATVASAVQEQSATAEEMSRSVGLAAAASDRIAERMRSVTEATNVTSDGVRSTRDATQDLQVLSDGLAESVARFSV